MSKCTSARSATVRSASCCIQSRELLAAAELPSGVGVERGDGLRHRAAGDDAVAGRDHVVGEPLELLPAPGVGLLEVDGGTQELARGEDVALPADRLAVR